MNRFFSFSSCEPPKSLLFRQKAENPYIPYNPYPSKDLRKPKRMADLRTPLLHVGSDGIPQVKRRRGLLFALLVAAAVVVALALAIALPLALTHHTSAPTGRAAAAGRSRRPGGTGPRTRRMRTGALPGARNRVRGVGRPGSGRSRRPADTRKRAACCHLSS